MLSLLRTSSGEGEGVFLAEPGFIQIFVYFCALKGKYIIPSPSRDIRSFSITPPSHCLKSVGSF